MATSTLAIRAIFSPSRYSSPRKLKGLHSAEAEEESARGSSGPRPLAPIAPIARKAIMIQCQRREGPCWRRGSLDVIVESTPLQGTRFECSLGVNGRHGPAAARRFAEPHEGWGKGPKGGQALGRGQ